IAFPELIEPFSLGVGRGGEYMAAWSFQRAMFGVVVSGVIALGATLLGRERHEPPPGLMFQSIAEGMRRYKGAELTAVTGKKAKGWLEVGDDAAFARQRVEVHPGAVLERWVIRVPPAMMATIGAAPGDLVCVSDHRFWLGGL